jgi:hypothetical protein
LAQLELVWQAPALGLLVLEQGSLQLLKLLAPVQLAGSWRWLCRLETSGF